MRSANDFKVDVGANAHAAPIVADNIVIFILNNIFTFINYTSQKILPKTLSSENVLESL